MTGDGIPPNPSVLNTTVLSNFAYIDQYGWLQDSLESAQFQLFAGNSKTALQLIHIFSQHSIHSTTKSQSRRFRIRSQTGRRLSVAISTLVKHRRSLSRTHDGRLLTDDGDARSFAKDQGVTVVGSVGVLLAAIDAGNIDEATADEWLSTWIDEIGYYVPYRTISEYR
nr:twitching motility protein PilT [Haloarchaeobius amylolyticus]